MKNSWKPGSVKDTLSKRAKELNTGSDRPKRKHEDWQRNSYHQLTSTSEDKIEIWAWVLAWGFLWPTPWGEMSVSVQIISASHLGQHCFINGRGIEFSPGLLKFYRTTPQIVKSSLFLSQTQHFWSYVIVLWAYNTDLDLQWMIFHTLTKKLMIVSTFVKWYYIIWVDCGSWARLFGPFWACWKLISQDSKVPSSSNLYLPSYPPFVGNKWGPTDLIDVA